MERNAPFQKGNSRFPRRSKGSTGELHKKTNRTLEPNQGEQRLSLPSGRKLSSTSDQEIENPAGKRRSSSTDVPSPQNRKESLESNGRKGSGEVKRPNWSNELPERPEKLEKSDLKDESEVEEELTEDIVHEFLSSNPVFLNSFVDENVNKVTIKHWIHQKSTRRNSKIAKTSNQNTEKMKTEDGVPVFIQGQEVGGPNRKGRLSGSLDKSGPSKQSSNAPRGSLDEPGVSMTDFFAEGAAKRMSGVDEDGLPIEEGNPKHGSTFGQEKPKFYTARRSFEGARPKRRSTIEEDRPDISPARLSTGEANPIRRSLLGQNFGGEAGHKRRSSLGNEWGEAEAEGLAYGGPVTGENHVDQSYWENQCSWCYGYPSRPLPPSPCCCHAHQHRSAKRNRRSLVEHHRRRSSGKYEAEVEHQPFQNSFCHSGPMGQQNNPELCEHESLRSGDPHGLGPDRATGLSTKRKGSRKASSDQHSEGGSSGSKSGSCKNTSPGPEVMTEAEIDSFMHLYGIDLRQFHFYFASCLNPEDAEGTQMMSEEELDSFQRQFNVDLRACLGQSVQNFAQYQNYSNSSCSK